MGIEIPSTYVTVAPSAAEMNVASIVWGVSIAFFLFSAAKGVRQSWGIWKRTRTITAYVALIWMEWIVCVAMSPVLWFYIWGTIKPSFGLFFSILCLWTFQMQCIIQIIINRIALLVRDQARIRTLQWSAAVVIGLINISVFCIWIPAQMQISPTWINVNFYWDRVEKAIFAIIDCGLNIYFVRLIRSKLISNGLTKYYPLFYFNCVMIAISVCLDGILILSMELAFVYTMFHPTVYIIKLYIEMNMADLITKTVQSSNKKNNGGASGSGANVYGLSSSTKKEKAMANKGAKSYWPGSGGNRSDGKHTAVQMQTLVTADGHKAEERDLEHGGIRRKVETQVVHEPRDDDAQSRTSSTEQLQKKFGIM